MDRYSPTLSGAVIACNILKDLEGIALPMYFFGSGTCCSLGGRFACISSIILHFKKLNKLTNSKIIELHLKVQNYIEQNIFLIKSL